MNCCENCTKLIQRRKAEDGDGYLTSQCAGGRGSTAHTPEAGKVGLLSPDSLGKIIY